MPSFLLGFAYFNQYAKLAVFHLLSDLLDLITRVLISNRVESNNAGYSHVVYFVFSLRTVKVHTKSCDAENGFADSILVVVASQQDYYKACVTDTTVQQKMCGTWLNIATTVFIIRPDCGKISF